MGTCRRPVGWETASKTPSQQSENADLSIGEILSAAGSGRHGSMPLPAEREHAAGNTFWDASDDADKQGNTKTDGGVDDSDCDGSTSSVCSGGFTFGVDGKEEIQTIASRKSATKKIWPNGRITLWTDARPEEETGLFINKASDDQNGAPKDSSSSPEKAHLRTALQPKVKTGLA